ncbi:MAG: hypothetical protein Q8876_08445 [Bacillota bacterium]|nr:hypothetical protein [Bacillota bacterium]
MKLAIIGSRNITDINLDNFVPKNATMIISGGAIGIDSLAEEYADRHCLKKLIIKPDYSTFGKVAPLIRNKAIVNAADQILAIWDGKSPGTKFTMDYAEKKGKLALLILV